MATEHTETLWTPPDIRKHPMVRRVVGAAFSRSGDITRTAVDFSYPSGDKERIYAVSRLHPGDVDAPRMGRQMALWNAMNHFQMLTEERRRKRRARQERSRGEMISMRRSNFNALVRERDALKRQLIALTSNKHDA